MENNTDDSISEDVDDKHLGIDAYYELPNFSSLLEEAIMEPNKIYFTSYMNLNYLEEFNKFFKILLFPDGNGSENRGFISIVFEVDPSIINSGITVFKLSAIFSAVDVEENLKYSQSFLMEYSEECFENQKSPFRFGLDRFLRRSTLLDSDDLLPGDKLTLQCSLQYASTAPEFTPEKVLADQEMIQIILDRVFVVANQDGEPTYSLKLGSKDNVVWRVLRQKSHYFDKLYEMATKEGRHALLPFSPKEYHTFVNMLYFFYLGNLEHVRSSEEMCELYILAERDDVQELKQLCSEYFQSNLTIDNAAELFAFADLHNDKNLKEQAVKLILADWLEVIKTESWNCLMEERGLAKEIVGLILKTFITW